jgi:uncharacterized protein YukE
MSRGLLLGPIDPMGGRSIAVPPPVQGDPEGLRTAARQLEQATVALDQVVVTARMVVFHLTSAEGWRGPAASAFSDGAVEPASQALSSIARELERVAAALRGGANAIEEAQAERRHAENLAIAAGVGVALTLLTFAVSDVLAADAAATASALMVRAAAAAASAGRAVSAAVEAAEEAIQVLAIRLGTMTPELLSAASITIPRFLQSPAGAGIAAAAGTASLGDRDPADLILAFGLTYLEGKAGEVDPEGRPRLRRYQFNIQENEAYGGTHVVDQHVGRSDEQLAERNLRKSSTFPDQATAEWAIQRALDANQDRIEAWLRFDSSVILRPEIRFDTGEAIGRVLTRAALRHGTGSVETATVRVVLRRSAESPSGFVVHTAFPDLP